VGVRGLLCPAPHVQENFRYWGHEGHKKGDKLGLAVAGGGNADKTDTVSRSPALQTAKCASGDDVVYWYCSLNVFGSQLFDR
jgi:hypothetical protein